MRNHLYKWMIEEATDHCYRNCLNYFEHNSSILDVGIGNGLMMKTYHPLIKSKGLKITGLDINKAYLNHCDSLIHSYGLENHIRICNQPVETYIPLNGNCYDFILFSMSFMLLKDQKAVLQRVKNWLKPGGKVVFFQTIFKMKSKLMEYVKPRLRYITTIDFGSVTYENDFFKLLEETNLSILEDRLLKRKWFKGEYRMIVTEKANETK
ncbi:MAG: class I SAM-dependent methyltransferase [Deltaproteobacteria bacterium]|nr:class I SAM-dependent methyltransferase [Deltaproteobacteria bacterium]MBW1995672.1 class I SAM-dependent methyltransferase [Deltaproteobacteria bacterium]MBW2150746.1 class I SAM-dependent methyltransferase [Deltaproteobacteria bacterium]